MGLKYTALRFDAGPIWDVHPLLREADLAFAVGRGVYESLACGLQVVVFDARGEFPQSDGLLLPETIEKSFKCNCSGRAFGIPWTGDYLSAVMEQYQYNPWGRAWSEAHCDIRNTVSSYLGLMR